MAEVTRAGEAGRHSAPVSRCAPKLAAQFLTVVKSTFAIPPGRAARLRRVATAAKFEATRTVTGESGSPPFRSVNWLESRSCDAGPYAVAADSMSTPSPDSELDTPVPAAKDRLELLVNAHGTRGHHRPIKFFANVLPEARAKDHAAPRPVNVGVL